MGSTLPDSLDDPDDEPPKDVEPSLEPLLVPRVGSTVVVLEEADVPLGGGSVVWGPVEPVVVDATDVPDVAASSETHWPA